MNDASKIPDWLENSLGEQFDNAIDAMQPKGLDKMEKRIAKLDSQSRYTEKSFVAQGGMKTISKVYDELTGRAIAMAELRDPFDQIVRELFVREAQINAVLQHPNILQIYDFGFNYANHPYFTMKLLQGKTLNKHLLSSNLKEDRNLLLTKFIAVCEAVAFAHTCGIMHLDLKPRNIWIGDFDETLVMDWGLARIFESACDERLLDSEISEVTGATIYGIVRGTPGYMSPEQANKKSHITYRADIFSLGAILYRLLTGQTPFKGNSNNEVIRKTKNYDWKRPSELSSSLNIPESLEAIVVKAMAKKAHDRYESAADMADDVRAYLNGFATTAENAGIIKQAKLQYMRNRKVYNLILFFLLMISSVTAISLQAIKKRTEIAGKHKAIAKSATAKLQKEQQEKQRLGRVAADEFFRKGKGFFDKKEYTKAFKLLKESEELGKKSPELYHYLSGVYIQSGNFNKFIFYLKKAEKTSAEGSFIHSETSKTLTIFQKIFKLKKYSIDEIFSFSKELENNNIFFYTFLIEEYLYNYPLPLDKKIDFVKKMIKKTNNNSNLTVDITKLDYGVKVNLNGNGDKLKWGYGIHILPVVELDVSNTSYRLGQARTFPELKILNLRQCEFNNLSFFAEAPLEELCLSESFRTNLKDVTRIPTLKKIYVPELFRSQSYIIKELEKKKVKVIFE